MEILTGRKEKGTLNFVLRHIVVGVFSPRSLVLLLRLKLQKSQLLDWPWLQPTHALFSIHSSQHSLTHSLASPFDKFSTVSNNKTAECCYSTLKEEEEKSREARRD